MDSDIIDIVLMDNALKGNGWYDPEGEQAKIRWMPTSNDTKTASVFYMNGNSTIHHLKLYLASDIRSDIAPFLSIKINGELVFHRYYHALAAEQGMPYIEFFAAKNRNNVLNKLTITLENTYKPANDPFNQSNDQRYLGLAAMKLLVFDANEEQKKMFDMQLAKEKFFTK